MSFQGFTSRDFDVFHVPGLEARMAELIEHVRPKLNMLGTDMEPFLSTLCGELMFNHVAKHARRTVNPPNDTWVAWANNKRGYKAYPHFQVGMFASHLFIQFAIIYESENKSIFARNLKKQLKQVMSDIPSHYFWSMDHMKPETTPHSTMKKAHFQDMADKLQNVKKSEVMCGLAILRDDPILSDGAQLIQLIEQTFETLMSLYRISF